MKLTPGLILLDKNCMVVRIFDRGGLGHILDVLDYRGESLKASLVIKRG